MNRADYLTTGFADTMKAAVPTRKGIYCAVCLVGELPEKNPEQSTAIMEEVLSFLGRITLRQLMTVFPPTKEYDGEKYGCKDYFSTMDAVQDFGPDTPMGDQVLDFLWDYNERHIREMIVRFMCITSALRRQQGQKGIAEEYMEKQGVHGYYNGTDAYGRKVLVDGVTDEVQVLSKPKAQKPRWWRIIEGGAVH